MTPPIDIFRLEDKDSVLWIQSAPTVEAAEDCLRKLATHSPGDYVFLNHATGTKIVLHLSDAREFPETDVRHLVQGSMR